MLSASLEEFLEAIYQLSTDTEEIRVTDIAKITSATLPVVVKALNRLKYQKYLVYQPYQSIELTEKGKKSGAYLVARNELVKEFLGMVYTRNDVEKEAEILQHYLNYDTMQSIEKFVMFMRMHPEVQQRYHIFMKRNPKSRILPDNPDIDELY